MNYKQITLERENIMAYGKEFFSTENQSYNLEAMTDYSIRSFSDEGDSSPMPTEEDIKFGLDSIFQILEKMFDPTRLKEDFPSIANSIVNVFHYKLSNVNTSHDKKCDEIRIEIEQRYEDSDNLEKLQAHATAIDEQIRVFELLRDYAADLYKIYTCREWTPSRGSKVSKYNKSIDFSGR